MSRDWVLDASTLGSKIFYSDIEDIASDRDFMALLENSAGQVSCHDIWARWKPHGMSDCAAQGWKVHVSATVDNCMETLARVATFCDSRAIEFKVARSRALHQLVNGKHMARGSAGKFITLYPPQDLDTLSEIVSDLTTRLKDLQGPQILSDLRIEGSPVHLRWGAFSEMTCLVDGVPTPAVRRPDGKLVPDVRQAAFKVPEWVPIPPFINEAITKRRVATHVDLPFTIEGALQFSNAGGVYRGTLLAHDTPIVALEGRPMAGLDALNRDGFTRMKAQFDTLYKLRDTVGVPKVYGWHIAAGHGFLLVQLIEGQSLTQKMLDQHPLVIRVNPSEQELQDYADWVTQTWRQICAVVHKIHQAGVSHGDIHPDNVILDEEGSPWLIDFEYSTTTESLSLGIGANGYQSRAGATGSESDRFQLAALMADLLLPIPLLVRLDENQPMRVVEAIKVRYKLAPDLVSELDWLASQYTRQGASAPLSEQSLVDGAVEAYRFGGDVVPGSADLGVDRLLSYSYGLPGLAYVSEILEAPQRDTSYKSELLDQIEQSHLTTQPSPGLFHGTLGAAAVLAELGATDRAGRLLDHALSSPWSTAEQHVGLARGVAGDGLCLIGLGNLLGERELSSRGLKLLASLASSESLGTSRSAGAPLGLISGGAGVAFALLRAFEASHDVSFLKAAERFLKDEMACSTWLPDGRCTLSERSPYGMRNLPYLDRGMAGWAVVAADYQQLAGSTKFGREIDGALRSCVAVAVREPGLLNGRAGLAVTLALLGGPVGEQEALRHIEMMQLYAMKWRGYDAVPGAKLLRLSMDFATGSLGVAIALDFIRERRPTLNLHPLLKLRRTYRNTCREEVTDDGYSRPSGTPGGDKE